MERNLHWNTKQSLLKLLYRLVEVPSVTGTRGELRMEEEIFSILNEIPYFQKHQNQLYRKEIKGDALGRKAVAALYKGFGKTGKTIVLLSHYDVVGTEDYGSLSPLAFLPSEYTSALVEESLPADIEEELSAGNWLFARGIMDMKAGLAGQIALLSEICLKCDLAYNILLLATPDEERYSMGMFAGVELLDELRKEQSLSYELTICSEPSFSAYPGDRTKYFYTGSVGKLLPLIFCMGTETHVGEPLEGLNAAWMASVYADQAECCCEFLEQARGEQNPLPTLLKMMDLKESYNVQTPTSAYILLNILTLEQNPDEVVRKLCQLGEFSAKHIRERIKVIYDKLGYGEDVKQIPHIDVYTFDELYKRGKDTFGMTFTKEVERKLDLLRQDAGGNMGKLTAEIAETVASFFKSLAPFYLILLAPPYYPHAYLGDEPRDRKAQQIVEDCVELARQRFGEDIRIKSYFQGLSDVSYCRVRDRENVIPVLEKFMPLYGCGYDLPLATIHNLNIPTINIGPYGKDAHKRTERLELHFSIEVFPELLKHAVYSF